MQIKPSCKEGPMVILIFINGTQLTQSTNQIKQSPRSNSHPKPHQFLLPQMACTSLPISNPIAKSSLGNQDSLSNPKTISKTNPNPSLSLLKSSTKLPPLSSSPTMVTESYSLTLLQLKTHKNSPFAIKTPGMTIKIKHANFAQMDVANVLIQPTVPPAKKIPSTSMATMFANPVLQLPLDAKSARTTPHAQIATLMVTSIQLQTLLTKPANVLLNST